LFRLGADLFGAAAGLMAATLWSFSPMVLGHASLIAPDAHATSLGLAACVYPHSISYFNALAGGPANGPAHLLHSNVDWGQDLLFLEAWVGDQPRSPEMPLKLAFYNYYNPFDLEIDGVQPWPFRRGVASGKSVPDGYYAISVNLLYEYPWPVRDRRGRRYSIDRRPLAFLREQNPVGRAGYSIRIFSADQVRSAYAAPEQPPLWTGFDRDR